MLLALVDVDNRRGGAEGHERAAAPRPRPRKPSTTPCTVPWDSYDVPSVARGAIWDAPRRFGRGVAAYRSAEDALLKSERLRFNLKLTIPTHATSL